MALSERARFDRCLREVLRHEGGWSNHPKDPGGATMKGVTQRVYDAYRDKQRQPRQSVRYIGDRELSDLYRGGYWLAASCDKLPAGVDLMVFDLSVNSGVDRGKKFLQAAAGATPDGAIGPKTLAAVAAASPITLVNSLRDRRENFYRSLPTFPTFGRGWLIRLRDVHKLAVGWAK